jgi:anti-anti-sigma regulatory factor
MRLAFAPMACEHMLKISTIESSGQCRLVLEGNLIAPWAGELKTACERVRAELNGRKLVVDIKYLISISQEGENVLLELMDDGVTLRGCGMFTRHILKQLAQRKRRNHREATS